MVPKNPAASAAWNDSPAATIKPPLSIGSEARLVRGFLCCKARNRVKRWERVSVGQLTEAPGNSKNSTTFWERLQKTLFPGNLDRTEGTCLESAVDLLIPRPS